MDEFKIWALEDASSVVELQSQRQMEAESLLEDTLVANPDLLMPGLKLVGRQTPTAGGPLDLLGVDRYGRLSLFELKRGTPYPRGRSAGDSTTRPTLKPRTWPSWPTCWPGSRASAASTRSRTWRNGTDSGSASRS